MSYNLTGKIALVTGTVNKRGIGRATALRLAQDGANVVVVDEFSTPEHLSEDDIIEGWHGLESLVKEIEGLGHQGLAIVADISQSKQVNEMVRKTLDKFGKIDILVNNAAILGPKALTLDYDEETWQRVLAVNLTGSFLCSKAVARVMVERGHGGKIINVASEASKRAVQRLAAYSASKAGLINLTQTMAAELGKYNIYVNALCCGTTATELSAGKKVRSLARKLNLSIEEATARAYQEVYPEAIPAIPLGRISQPEEQANIIAFLASSESNYITGAVLNATGGRLMVL